MADLDEDTRGYDAEYIEGVVAIELGAIGAAEWMATPNARFAGRAPSEMMTDLGNYRVVNDEAERVAQRL